MRLGSIFAGIGGFDLGFERAGHTTTWAIEIQPECQKLLKLRFPGIQVFGDVTQVTAEMLTEVDIITFGFPCQDLSVAGARAGLSGTRSGLFFHATRIIDGLRPSFAVFENVPGLFSSDDGRDFARVLLELERIGYSGAWRTLDAQYLGVAQRRRRIFGVFARADIRAKRCAEILSLPEGVRGHPAPRRRSGQRVAGTFSARTQGGGGLGTDFECDGGLVAHTLTTAYDASEDGIGRGTPLVALPLLASKNGPRVDAETETLIAFSCKDHGADATHIISPTLRAMPHDKSHANGGGQIAIAFNWQAAGNQTSLGTNTLQTSQVPAVAGAFGVRRITPIECERLQGFPDGWTSLFSDSTRYRMLGNAVCVNVAEWIARRI